MRATYWHNRHAKMQAVRRDPPGCLNSAYQIIRDMRRRACLPRDPSRRAMCLGALWGLAAGLAVTLYSQIQPRLNETPEMFFTGAPQGQDQWVYFSMIRALWRSPNGLTYCYPFTLFWSTPAVMFQAHFTVLAWIARLTGLPAAFEIGRVAGAAVCGSAIGFIGAKLCPGARWRKWFWIALVLGGGWFTWGAAGLAIEVAGVDGLTEWAEYVPRFMGPLYSWLPFVLENITLPIEPIYHAVLFCAMAALMARRNKLALGLGLAAWFSHPFTAAALTMPVLAWWAWAALTASGRERRDCIWNLAGWTAITALAIGYYHVLLGQWEGLRELAKLYKIPVTGMLSPVKLLLLVCPWFAGLIWSVFTSAGRRRVWGRPAWRLFGLLAATQLVLLMQGIALGERAIQPFHYNRGCLEFGLVVVFWRAATSWAQDRRIVPVWLIVAVSLTLPDQALFFLRSLGGVWVGFASRDYAGILSATNSYPPGRLILNEIIGTGLIISAFSDHVPYDAPESMVVPFWKERADILHRALNGEGRTVRDLGVDLAIVDKQQEMIEKLATQGWRTVTQRGRFVLMAPP